MLHFGVNIRPFNPGVYLFHMIYYNKYFHAGYRVEFHFWTKNWLQLKPFLATERFTGDPLTGIMSPLLSVLPIYDPSVKT